MPTVKVLQRKSKDHKFPAFPIMGLIQTVPGQFGFGFSQAETVERIRPGKGWEEFKHHTPYPNFCSQAGQPYMHFSDMPQLNSWCRSKQSHVVGQGFTWGKGKKYPIIYPKVTANLSIFCIGYSTECAALELGLHSQK